MLKYCAAVCLGVAGIILAAMAVVRYVEISMGVDAAISFGYVVGPVALLAMGLMMASLDGWRCRLVVACMMAH